MQVFGNVATVPARKESKTTGKGYYEMRLAEAQRGIDSSPTFYTVRIMKDDDPLLDKGDFVKVTGKLKADFYIGRDGKPSGTLLIIAFEASKIAKPAALKDEPTGKAQGSFRGETRELECAPVRAKEGIQQQGRQRPPEPVQELVQQDESDWSTLYN